MENDKQNYQVIIVGGGPAGIATAITLSARGISNCIIEAQTTPVAKPGEAIPPNAKPLLKQLGIDHLVKHPKHLAYYGNKSCWGTAILEQEEFIQSVYGHGYLLDRLFFEQQLRDYISNFKCDFFQGYKLKKVSKTDSGITVLIDNGINSQTIRGKFIVDATGRKASVCHQLGIHKQTIDTQFALTFKGTLTATMEHQIMVEATENGWWYIAPQQNQELTLMFFTLQELLPSKQKSADFLKKELKKSLHLSKFMETVELNFDVITIMPTGTSYLESPYGDHWLAVGDAAYAYDPISSYGITSALASGYYAGHAIASHFANEVNALAAYRYVVDQAFDAYLKKLSRHYAIETRWKDSIYWKDRFQLN